MPLALDAGIIVLAWMPFLLDAGLSLIQRLIRKENIFQAHREHLYQKLLAKQWSPEKILAFYALLDLVFFLPIALWFFLRSPWPVYMLGICLTVGTCFLFFKLKKP